ncbi:MAG: glycosyltransferase 87 family protein [Pseudomonadota bacterium]
MRRQGEENSSGRTVKPLFLVGGALALCMAAIAAVSPLYYDGAPLTARNTFIFVGLLIAAGAAYLPLFHFLPRARPERRHLIIMLTVGLLCRLVFFGSTPIYEDDWRRYLWDGAVVNEGISPYRYAPAEAIVRDSLGAPIERSDDPALQRLQDLGEANGAWPEYVNYPYVTTIYPPVAQAAMAAANKLAPFSLDAWRLVLLLFDAAALAIIIQLLRASGSSAAWALVYWWNPLIIYAGYNAAHMDLLIAPFLLGALYFVKGDRPFAAGALLVGAIGVKIWPALLAPALFARWSHTPLRFAAIALFITALSALTLAPMLSLVSETRSGLSAYSGSWQTFSFLFSAIKGFFSLLNENADMAARIVFGLSAVGASLGAGVFVRNREQRLSSALLFVAGALFFLSPTGYPWYAIWLFVFLPFAPSIGVAALTASLPLYYGRYWLVQAGYENILVYAVTPLAFAAPLALIAWEQLRNRRAHTHD